MGWIKDRLARLFHKHSPSRTAIDAIKENWDAYQKGFERGLRNAEGTRFPWESIIGGIDDNGFPIYSIDEKELRDIMRTDGRAYSEMVDKINEQLRG